MNRQHPKNQTKIPTRDIDKKRNIKIYKQKTIQQQTYQIKVRLKQIIFFKDIGKEKRNKKAILIIIN